MTVDGAPPPATRALLEDAAAAERAGDDARCGALLVRAQRAAPPVLPAVQLALDCAARLAIAGRTAPPAPQPDAVATPLLSVVTCSIDARKYDALEAHLRKVLAGRPWELVGIHDARSLG